MHFHSTIVPEANYRRMNDLIAVMHSTMPKDIFNEPYIKFTPKGVHIEMTFTELLDTVLSIRFSESLAEILGADADVAYDRSHARTSRRFSLVNDDINSTYIYCDIQEHVTVGDTKAPLLRIVEKDTMRGKPYCCDASRHMYEDYYSRQVGGQMPVFVGSRHQ